MPNMYTKSLNQSKHILLFLLRLLSVIGLLVPIMGCEYVPLVRGPMDGPFKYQLNPIYRVAQNNIIVDLEGNESFYYIQYVDTLGPNYPDKFDFIIRDENYDEIDQINIQGRMSNFDFFDWKNDGVKELWIVYENNDSCFVQIVNSLGKKIFNQFLFSGEPREDGKTSYEWFGSVHSIHYEDLNNDGENEFIVVPNEMMAAKPRGIYVYDGQTLDFLWNYEVGPAINLPPTFEDLNGDGRLEILISSNAPYNHNVANDSADSLAYIFLLSHDGKFLWKNEYGGKFSSVYAIVDDFDNDANLNILALLGDPGTIPNPQVRLEYLNPESGEPGLMYPFLNFMHSSFRVLQVNLDTKKEIVLRDVNGSLVLFDANFKKINQRQFRTSINNIHNAGDLLGNGLDEILIETTTGFFLLNQDLEIIAKLSGYLNFLGRDRIFTHPRRNAITLLATYFPDKTIYSELVQNPHYSLQLFLPWFVLILVSGSIYFLIARFRRKSKIRSLQIKYIKSAQKIAHDIKTPLSSVNINLHTLQDRLEKENLVDKTGVHDDIETMKTELNRVEELTKSFLKFVDLEKPKFQVVDLREIVQNTINHFAAFLNNQLSIEVKLDKDAVEAWVDPKQIEQVFQILIENAIDALQEKGKIRIIATVYEPIDDPAQQMIQIEVANNGPDIDPQNIEKVFDPSFTTKKGGTGMGLTMAKKTIEDHGGEIDVFSKNGLGSTFRFTLPKFSGEG